MILGPYSYDKTVLAAKKRQMLERLGKNEEQLKAELQFHAIFLWSDAVNLELNLQVRLSSKSSI
jgi:hypothetical protein